jgi:glycosyltransferase involved in cell wall biosynthesis
MDKTEINNDLSICAIIPAYNIADYIARAIDSVLAQTLQPDQIIVVDDGSTDNTADIIKSYGSKVTYIYQQNAGLAASRNTGIKNTNCNWVAFLDGDDEWLPDNLKLQVEIIKNNPDLNWSAGNYKDMLYSSNRCAAHTIPETIKKLTNGKDFFDDYFRAYTKGAGGNSNTMFIKRSAIIDAGLFKHGLRFAEDWDMWMRMAYRFPKIGIVTEPIAVYYLDRPDSLMGQTPKQEKTETRMKLIDEHLILAEQFSRLQEFKPCAAFMIKRWIRGILFYNAADNIKLLLNKYSDLLGPGYVCLMKLLTAFPKTTACCCHLISKLIRMLNLRRRVVTLPAKLDSK